MKTDPENKNPIRALSHPEQSTDNNHASTSKGRIRVRKSPARGVTRKTALTASKPKFSRQEKDYRIPIVVRVPRVEFLHFQSDTLTNAEKKVKAVFGDREQRGDDFYQVLFRAGFEHDPDQLVPHTSKYLDRPDDVEWYQVWYYITDHYQVNVRVQAGTKREAIKLARHKTFYQLSARSAMHWHLLQRKVRPFSVWISHREHPDHEDYGSVDK